ncbi:hypothetical protein ACQPXB_36170 [Amycolatopsis sp. CA-161197]|uniref:hypothetical protein n=1 Tax=Amycolatopsis sp. CA-161197 TaxID=3239922 RepID=UPI003D923465
MATDRVRTANYSPEARARLAAAVLAAREATGKSRPQFVKAAKEAGIKLNVRSLELVENGDPGVGHTFLIALGQALPNWTERTPRLVLEGGQIPPVPDTPAPLSRPRHDDPPYEFSAEARQKMVTMTVQETLAFVEHERFMRGEEAAERAMAAIVYERERAKSIREQQADARQE